MNLFNSIFGNNEPSNDNLKLNWNHLTDLKQLEQLKSESFENPVVIFKHSTRCSISRMVLKNFENEFNTNDATIQLYYLDLLNHRDISNAITAQFQITHQSPQLIFIKDGQAIYNASHSDIDASYLSQLSS